MTHYWITGMFLIAAATLAACEPPESTARAINQDISAAHFSGPTPSQVGQASVTPDVIELRSSSMVPIIKVPMKTNY